MTFLDIKTAVLANVIDLPPAVVSAVPKLINDAVRAAERRYNFKYMEATSSFVTSAGVQLLGTVANFKEYRDRGPYVSRQYASAYDLYVVSDNGDVNRALLVNASYPSRPKYISNTGDGLTNLYSFSVWPFPDAISDWGDGNYRISVPYFRFSAVMSADIDTNWLVNNADDYIIEKATGEAMKKDWDYNGAAVWLQSAENKFVEIRLTDKKLRLSGVTTLVPHWEGGRQGMVIK